MTEAQFQASVIQLATLTGWRVYHHSRSDKGLRGGPGALGFPDLILVKRFDDAGRTLLIAAELKVGKRTTTDDQIQWLEHFHHVSDTSVGVVWRPDAAPARELWPSVETSEGPNFGAIGRRLRRR